MIGTRLSPILVEIESTLLEFEAYKATPPEFTIDGFRAAIKIMMSALMDKMWVLQEAENMSQQDRENMAQKAGEDMRQFIKTYTGIDTHKLYE